MELITEDDLHVRIMALLDQGFTTTGPISWPRFDPQCDDPEVYPFCERCKGDDTDGGFIENSSIEFYWQRCYECGAITFE